MTQHFFLPPSPLPVSRISRILGRVQQKKRKSRQRLCPSNRPGRAQKAPLRAATHDILFASCITPPNQGCSPKMTSNCCWIIGRNLAGTSYSACFRNQRRGKQSQATNLIILTHCNTTKNILERFYCLLRLFGGKSRREALCGAFF